MLLFIRESLMLLLFMDLEEKKEKNTGSVFPFFFLHLNAGLDK